MTSLPLIGLIIIMAGDELLNFVVKSEKDARASGTGNFDYQRTIRESLLCRKTDNSGGKIKAGIR